MVTQPQSSAEPKQPEDAEQAFFRALSTYCPVGVFSTDLLGRCTYLNSRCQSICGFSLKESLENSWAQFIHPDDREFVLTEWFVHTQAGREFSCKCRFQTPQATIRSVQVRSAPLLDDQGCLTGYVYALDDLTEPQPPEVKTDQLATQIQKQADVLNAILSASVDHIYLFDRVGCYQYVSQGGVDLLGFEPEDLIGKTWQDIGLPAVLMEQVDAQREIVMASGQPLTSEVDYVVADETHYYEYILTPWRSLDQTLEGVIAISRDITDRKRAEEVLRISEARFQAFMAHSPTSAWITDADGQIVYVSPTYCQMFQLSTEDVVGKTIFDVYEPQIAEEFLKNIRSVARTNQVVEAIESAPRPDGTVGEFLVYKFPIADPSGQALVAGVAIDITERRREDAEREELLIREQTARIEAEIAREQIFGILGSITDGFMAFDRDWRFTYLNQEGTRTLGRPREELLGKNLWKEFPEMADTCFGQLYQRAVAEGRPLELEEYYPPFDQWFAVRAYPSSVGLSLYFRNITERKQSEAAIAALHEDLQNRINELQTLFEVVPIGILISQDRTFKQVKANPTFSRILGISTAGNASYTPPNSRPTYKVFRDGQELTPDETPLRYAAIHNVTVERTEVDIVRQDGAVFNLFGYAAPLRDEQGKARGSVAAFLDISDRKRAEKAQQYLAEATQTLSSSLDYQTTLASIAHLAVPQLADWCTVHLIKEDGSVQPLVTIHANPAKVEWAKEINRKYPFNPNAPRGIAQVLRTGQSEFYPDIPDHLLVETARDAEHLNLLRQVGFRSAMQVPLLVGGRTLGVISFIAAESGRFYNLADLAIAEELARRAALAVENARLYQQAQQAQQTAERSAERIARLQSITAALSESLTPTQVSEVIAEQGMAVLGADSALVALLNDRRTELEIVRTVGYAQEIPPEWRFFPLDSAVPLAEAVRTQQPIWAESTEQRIARYPHLAEKYDQYNFGAWVSIPLVVESRSVGGISLGFAEPQLLNPEDQAFVLALAQQCAQAIARAHLYEAERVARSAAEAANRVKDEFLAVLSHELRTPLNPILGWAKLLRSRSFDASSRDRALETIERNAKLQTQLIEDLLDVSRILQGKLSLNICAINLAEVIEAAIETVSFAASTKSIQIHTVLAPTIVQVSGDPSRLQQVVWNLLSNAIKFTPAGGQVEIRLEQTKGQAQIRVTDTGQGIDPEFLPYVFDSFRQADGATTRKHGGLGLGLAIVRHIVELHGGVVATASPGAGQGATFVVRLPLLKNTTDSAANHSVAKPAPAGLEVSQSKEDKDELNQSEMSDSASLPLTGLQVLLVDDDADTRNFFTFVLQQAGAIVTPVASAEQALKTLIQTKTDVLLSDIGMPEMDGYMLIQQVRCLKPEQGGQIPAIALTAYVGEMDSQQAIAAGFQRHISKPVEPAELVTVIANLTKPANLVDR